jgi:predicted phosphoribosyltransferase
MEGSERFWRWWGARNRRAGRAAMWRTTTKPRLFYDRTDAGRRLAAKLLEYRDERPLVLALPRGGVVVGYEVARALDAPLDVIVARKVGAPGHRELGIGAIAPGGVQVFDPLTVRMLGIRREEIDAIVAEETVEMQRRIRSFRGDRPAPDLHDRTVVLVDDGLATGVTARAAIHSIRAERPRRLVLAVPVCAPETAEALRPEVDDLVCVETPPDFMAVGLWYNDFSQTTDEEVLDLLGRT